MKWNECANKTLHLTLVPGRFAPGQRAGQAPVRQIEESGTMDPGQIAVWIFLLGAVACVLLVATYKRKKHASDANWRIFALLFVGAAAVFALCWFITHYVPFGD